MASPTPPIAVAVAGGMIGLRISVSEANNLTSAGLEAFNGALHEGDDNISESWRGRSIIWPCSPVPAASDSAAYSISCIGRMFDDLAAPDVALCLASITTGAVHAAESADE